MSILTNTNSDPVSPATRAATRVKRSTAQLASTIIRDWERGFDSIWHNPRATPAEVLAELGTDAEEAFLLSRGTVEFLETILVGRLDDELARIAGKVAAMPEITYHEDGTVTIA